MNFVQFEFPIFFGLIFILFWTLKRRAWQNMLLVVCSAVFYGWVHPWFLLLLYGSAILDFNMGKRMVEDADNKKRYLWISMLGNVGMLGYFKYCNFFHRQLQCHLCDTRTGCKFTKPQHIFTGWYLFLHLSNDVLYD